MTAKETVRALFDRLPDDCSIDDVLYHLYVVQAVGEGLADSEAGRVVAHDRGRGGIASQMAARVREVIWAESARDALHNVITYIAQDSHEATSRHTPTYIAGSRPRCCLLPHRLQPAPLAAMITCRG
jgi:hypothetical protein